MFLQFPTSISAEYSLWNVSDHLPHNSHQTFTLALMHQNFIALAFNYPKLMCILIKTFARCVPLKLVHQQSPIMVVVRNNRPIYHHQVGSRERQIPASGVSNCAVLAAHHGSTIAFPIWRIKQTHKLGLNMCPYCVTWSTDACDRHKFFKIQMPKTEPNSLSFFDC